MFMNANGVTRLRPPTAFQIEAQGREPCELSSRKVVTEYALHRPRVGGSSDWPAKPTKQKRNVLLSTDPASVEAATFKLILLVNHPIELVFSSSIVAPTDSGSVESLP